MTPNSSPPTPHIALIGAGYWGKNLIRNFHQLGVLKTICDQSGAIRQQMVKDYPVTTITDDFNALISDPAIQAVVISAPAAQHHALATQALDAGKHCFVEKPLSQTYDEGAAVVRLKELINKGTIGSDYRHRRIYGIVETSTLRTHWKRSSPSDRQKGAAKRL